MFKIQIESMMLNMSNKFPTTVFSKQNQYFGKEKLSPSIFRKI